MQIAFITGVNHLQFAGRTGYYLVLPHLVDKYRFYHRFFKNIEGYKILDNSIIEIGNACSLDYLLSMAKKVNADEIVLPDVFNKGVESFELSKKNLDAYLKRKEKKKLKIQIVCHGATFEEWCFYWKEWSIVKEIDCIALPKVLDTTFGRAKALSFAAENNPLQKDIHLLGVWNNWNEITSLDPELKKMVRGFDTSLAYHFSCDNIICGDIYKNKPNYKIDLENDLSIDPQIIEKNQQFIINKI